jgi:hypothetical protein
MSVFIPAVSSAHAWASIMGHLLDEPSGKCFHLVTAISDPVSEDRRITQIVDALAKEIGTLSTMENANAIWPHVLAPPGQSLSTTFQRMERFGAPLIKAANGRHCDSYLERLIAWRSRDGAAPVKQLEKVIDRMKSEKANVAPKSSAYELSIFSPGLDAGYMSFPCLSHLSFKLDAHNERIHLAATYRNHAFVSHGYGNFLGLGRLLAFVAREVGYSAGELLSISTHADAELSRGRRRIEQAVSEAQETLSVPIIEETGPSNVDTAYA